MDNRIEEYNLTGLEIAVIGMAGRFPGAKNIAEFWENLKNGKESVSFFSEQELVEAGVSPGELKTPGYTRAKSILEGIHYFDADFFGYSPIEAEVMDPQVRLFHECVWHALEEAGYNPDTYNGLIGLYAGAKSSFTWEARSLISERMNVLGAFAVSTLNDKDYLSSRISYKLNLKGPCYTVQTACSTSLVAIHLACQALLGADCDIALAGAISLAVSGRTGYLHQEGMIYSADGHCRTFDQRATGTVFGDGVGIVVLKRYQDAIGDNDHIYALVKGSACNNDGVDRIGFTAPGIEGQTAVIRTALRMAEVEPETISYVEGHGTGTNLGDPIEIEALTRAFNTKRKRYCGIGSVKTNLGHLNTAAGAAGFIKTVLALKHQLIPPSLHFNQPNPGIDFENSPFYVNTGLCEWKNEKYPRRAGVSSFGIGGTNAHVVLEQAPVIGHSSLVIGEKRKEREYQLMLLSAKTETALDRMTTNLAEYLKKNPHINLADAAYTLQIGRKAFNYRRMLVCSNVPGAVDILSDHDPGKIKTSLTEEGKKPVIFMFPGQGSQYVNMGLELYQTEPVFRQEMDRCFEILEPLMGCDIKDILYPPAGDHRSNRSNRSYKSYKSHIDQTEIAQPLLFVFEYSLARLLMKWGIEPAAMMGHSIGEYAAACLSGVFSLEDALELVVQRGRLMQKMPFGAMLSISISEEQLKPLLDAYGNNEISLAAVNTPTRLVVSGTPQAVENFEKQLKLQGFECRLLHTSHAYHSKMMEPVLERFEHFVERFELKKSQLQIPYISNLTGDWITAAEAIEPRYWANHLRQPVRFGDGLARLLKKEDAVFIEVGPGSSLSTFVTQHPLKTAAQKVVNIIKHPREKLTDVYFLLNKLGELWLYGKTVDWTGFYAGEKRYRVPLPVYPFEGQHYWLDRDPLKMEDRIISSGRLNKRADISEWFYIPQWTRSALPPGDLVHPQQQSESGLSSTWLVFTDECGLGSALAERLKENQEDVVIVKKGPGFKTINAQESQYQIHPQHSKGYNTLLEELQKTGKLPDRVLHLWGVTGEKKNETGFGAETIERNLDTGFYSLLYLVQAIGNRNITRNIRLEAVTDGMQGVTGEEPLCPGKAVVPGVVKCISREYPNIICRSIDVVLPEPQTREYKKFIHRFLVELGSVCPGQVVAFRGAHRWVQSFEPIPLADLSATPPLLVKKGVYMITGGLGGIGLILSQYLVKTVNAGLILVGRSDFPSKEHWEKWLDSHDIEDNTSQKICKIQELEKAGGEVLVFSADVTDREQVQKVVTQSLEHFGRIHGVIHAAGSIQTGIIREKKPESIKPVLEAKVKGTLILDGLLAGIEPDFVMLCSSLAAVIPPPGRVDYAAANAFLDAYAYYKTLKEDIPVISVNWDVWQGVGMAAGPPGNTAGTPEGLLPEEGAAAFHRILEYGTAFSQIAVSIRDLNELIRQIQSSKSPVSSESSPGTISPGKRYRRPELRSRYAAPRDKLEELLAGIWQEYFGIRQVGIHDNFFELGGDSLKGMKFVNRYNRLLGEIVYINAIFEAPTIAELAAYFREHYPGAVGKLMGTGLDRESRALARGIDREIIEKISRLVPSPVPRPGEPGRETAKNPSAVFILSPPRSGSTLLRVMLGGHPRLFAPPELGLLFFNTLDEIDFRLQSLIRVVVQIKQCSVEEAKRLVEEFRGQPMTTKQFYRWLQEEIGESTLVDKTPNYALNPEVLKRCEEEFDNPVYIHLLRHPYGMIRSYDEAKLDLVGGRQVLKELSLSRLEYAELTWLINHQNILEFLKGIPAARQYRLKFEELVSQPDAVMKDFCGFLHLDFSPGMLEPYKDKKQRMTDGIYSEGIMIGDMKFHQHRHIDPGVAHTWKQHFHEDFLSEPTWQIAESFGYSRISAEKSKSAPYTQIETTEKKDYYPLSSSQKRLYVLQTIGSETGYNISNALVLEGRLNIKELEEIFKKLIKRQESFRTSFELVKGEPVQRIHREVEFEIEYYDLATEDTENTEGTGGLAPLPKEPASALISSFVRSFDLSKAPLLRIVLIKAAGNKYLLVKDMHHIISDGLSLGIITRDFSTLYGNKELPPLRIRYKDYSQWQNSKNRKESIKKQEEYWTGLFSGDIPVLNLPTDFARPPVQSFEGKTLTFLIGKEKSRALKEMALEEGGTSFMVILTIFNILLWKLSGQEDIVVGIDIEGRSHAGIQDIVGMFVNALALRNFPDPAKTFKAFLREVKTRTLEAFANQDYPFDELVENVSVTRDASRNPVFDVVFSFMDMKSIDEIPGIIWSRSDLKLEPFPYRNSTAKFDLTLIAREGIDGVTFSFEYCTKIFQEETIQRFVQYFKHIVSAVIENRKVKISQIRVISAEERKKLLFEFNHTKTPLVRDKNYSQLFEEQVIKNPGKIAAIYHDQHITYNTLNKKSNQLAHLLKKQGVSTNKPVALLCERSLETLMGMIGIFRAGGVYIPIETGMPLDRIKQILTDSETHIILTHSGCLGKSDPLFWQLKSLKNCILLDGYKLENTIEDSLFTDIWDLMAESSEAINAYGWNSSYTGEPFTIEEMKEYIHNFKTKLKPYLNPGARVLEIGCGHGLVLFEIAPQVAYYCAIDPSPAIIEKNKERLQKKKISHVRLEAIAASQIDRLEEKDFDLVVCSSVIHYFPDTLYLETVIKNALDLLENEGIIYLDDIMDLRKKEELSQSTAGYKKLNPDARVKTNWDEDLFVDVDFFQFLQDKYPEIIEIETSNKLGIIENELTRFRYDVLLKINKKNIKNKKKVNFNKKRYTLEEFSRENLNLLTVGGAPPTYYSNTDSSDLGYVIYTSGTSGTPKGVMIHQPGMINHLYAKINDLSITADDRVAQTASVGFDISVWQFLSGLLVGGAVIIIDKEVVLEAVRFLQTLQKEKVTIMESVPSLMIAFLERIGNEKDKELKHLRWMIPTGEPLTVPLVREWFRHYPGIKLVNAYGPTEASDDVTHYKIHEMPPGTQTSIPIGKPLQNLHIYILDRNLSLCPVGVRGEICVAGIGVGKGYLNNPELTGERFISPHYPNTPSPHHPIYKTGDIGYIRPDGNIECLGRMDYQVKIRGNRVEPGEIESRLSVHEGIKEAVVVDRVGMDRDLYLCAYFTAHINSSIQSPGPDSLREFLSIHLPDYMIPLYFVQLDRVPLTPTGKVDRKSLPDPGQTDLKREVKYAAPRSEIEKMLTGIWEKVLGRNNISIDDNFFLVGGDSIKAIQVVSRVNKAGYKIEMRDIFLNTSIAGLAPKLKKSEHKAHQSVITGTVPLTPIQREFFTFSRQYPHHYNQAVMLYSKEGFDAEILGAGFTKIQEHHDGLRMTYSVENEKVIQFNHGLEFQLSLQVFDFKNRENALVALRQQANEIQAGIHLEKGPLMKLGLFHLDDCDRLLIVIHHLVIDGVSWRILFEDIETLYSQYKKGEKLSLPAKTDSFKHWSEKLSLYADSQPFLKEKTYWTQLESQTIPRINPDFQTEDNNVKDIARVSFTLAEDETGLLLTKVNRVYQTEINDILLTALGLAIKKTFGQDRVLLALEGHGREEILENMDISRTVGWFTSAYPVILDISYANDLGRQVKEIKETLRRIPNKGIGYGILKYLTNEENKKEIKFKLKPQMSFNYFGQFDADVKQNSSFEIAKESAGNMQSLENQREYELDVSGMVTDNRLSMTFSYNEKHFKPGTMEALSNHLQSQLKDIITFCSSKEKIEFTPGDFTYKGLSIEDIDGLARLYPRLEDLYPLTPMQEGMLFHALMDDSSYSYFQQISYRLQGELDIALVERSLNELFKRHDILRTAFVYKDIRHPVQVVLQDRAIDFYYRDISDIREPGDKENFIKEFKEKDKKRGFDLSNVVLMRVSIFRLNRSRYEFTWSFHHILMDGWCIGILNTEFFEIYTAYLENRPYRLPIIKPYRTYIQWLDKQDKEASARYWQNYLESFAEQTGIPKTTLRRKKEKAYKHEQVSVPLNREKTSQLTQLAAGHHVTLNTVTQAVWGILLGKYNGKEDVVFGAVVSGRPFELAGVESMVGLFINTIPVRIRFAPGMKFHRLLERVQEQAISSEPHHYHPLAEIQAGTSLKQNLLDHLFIFENYPIAEQIEGYGKERNEGKLKLKLTHIEIFEQTNYDFNVLLTGTGQLKIIFQYNGNTYDSSEVNRIAHHLLLLFDQVMENEELEVGSLTLLSKEEKNRLLYEFNDTEIEYPKDKTIHELFAEQVKKNPDHIALVGVHETHEKHEQNHDMSSLSYKSYISYKELNEKSRRLAYSLQEQGVQPDTIVGIMVERSLEMIVGIFGILKAGGAYLPIDPNYPEDRINYMLTDSNARFLVTTACLSEKFEKLSIVNCQLLMVNEMSPNCRRLNNPPKEAISVNNYQLTINNSQLEQVSLAYIIYTSGTTGRPKGALIEHRNVVRLLFNDKFRFDFHEGDVWTLFHSYCFDFSVWEMYGALLYGGKLIIVSRETARDAVRFWEILEKQGVTILNQTPSAFYSLLSAEQDRHAEEPGITVRYVIFGGEALNPMKLKPWKKKYPGTKLINMFGITETTVHVTFKEINEKEIKSAISNIGKPIPTLSTYIMDRYLRLQSVGAAGECCVGGEGVGRGYLNRPQLTTEKFVINPYKPGERLYRSGDLLRYLGNGDMEYLGRIDHQAKIRGFRIELGEIENRLLKHLEVKEAVVIGRENQDGEKYLCAYIVTGIQFPGPKNLREFLSRTLPDYMLPSHFVELEQIPLTPNGKIDRKALPEPGIEKGKGYIAPANEIQEKLANTWSKILGIPKDKIGIDTDFFLLGGHSLNATMLKAKIHKEFNRDIPLAEIFEKPTIREIADVISSAEKVKFTDLQTIEEKEYYDISFSQERLWIINQREPGSAAYNIPFRMILPDEVDEDVFKKVLYKLAERHESLRTSIRTFAGKTCQVVAKEIEIPYKKIDLSAVDEREKQRKTREIFAREMAAPFELSTAPLFRVILVKLSSSKYEFILNMHHIISDGWSMDILWREFALLYEAGGNRKEVELPPLKLQYKDFAQWQNRRLTKTGLAVKTHRYWKEKLSRGIPLIELPADFKVNKNDRKAAAYRFVVKKDIKDRLNKLGTKHQTTLFIVMFSIYNILLSHLLRQEEIVCGIINAGRGHNSLENIVGYFVNMIVFKCHVDQEEGFDDFLQGMNREVLEAFSHEYPLELVLKELDMKFPEISLSFNMLNMWSAAPDLELDEFESYRREDSTDINFDIETRAQEYKNGIEILCKYRKSMFRFSTIKHIMQAYIKLLDDLSTEQEQEQEA